MQRAENGSAPGGNPPAPLRILYVHHGRGIGGAPLSLLFLIRSLDRARFEPTVLCIHESEAAELFRRNGIETIVDPVLRDFSHTNVLWYPWWQLPKILLRLCAVPRTVRRMGAILASRKFDLVHLNTSTLLACGIAARRAGVPVVWHIREPLAEGYLGLRRYIARRIIDRCATRIIPICRYDGEQLLPSERIRVVYNFIEFERFDRNVPGDSVRREFGIEPGAPLIVMLGGINRIKGTEVFVRAALRVVKVDPRARFLVVGAEPVRGVRSWLNGTRVYHRRVYALAALAAPQVIFAGVRSDIPEVLAASDILCFPSIVPHFARPIIEAAAMARPVVASDLGGPRELVRYGQTGWLVKPGDPAVLAEALLMLMRDSERRRQMGEAGCAMAHELFDAARNVRQVMEVYEEALRS